MVRGDLPPGLQVAQAVHASVEHTLDYPVEVEGAPTVVVLSIPDERRLEALAQDLDLPISAFREPDLGGEMTALAVISPQGHTLLRRLTPLHAREEVRK